ncbi:VanW family protein [Paenibacillus sp. IB182496]|uniref:VanW family protein n=1 Tax=Paenibacillus sabuli TaxID=2772509 RepID=A0A927GT73_9BACL|nr:VanW family protein [Paenibacillus sabuli]MBD2846795.1 VanW family protein [Paenibacillus sabuli]
MRPVKRSALRLKLGKWWYTGRRYAAWATGRERLAKVRDPGDAAWPSTVFEHATPLFRALKDVEDEMQLGKVHNLRLAAPRLNGLMIQPGETFSYWRTIGKPSKRKGYRPGMVLYYGRFRSGIGGGLCQLSNLIYWMALHSPLEVTERHRHSYDVFPDTNRTQPFGSGATCAYNYLDLQLHNPTPHAFRLRIEVTDSELQGRLECERPLTQRYEVYEREHAIAQEAWGGYVRRNVIGRRCLDMTGIVLEDCVVTSNQALMMYAPMLSERAEH